jgi:hypothetical protein
VTHPPHSEDGNAHGRSWPVSAGAAQASLIASIRVDWNPIAGYRSASKKSGERR